MTQLRRPFLHLTIFISQKESERLSKNKERHELSQPTEGGSAGRDPVASQDPQVVITTSSGNKVYEEIRIKRSKRRSLKTLTFEEEVEVADANVDTSDLISSNLRQTQTDPIAEPPPVYRPKMEEMQLQTESNLKETSEPEIVDVTSKEAIQK
ncbi:uncharacterized protein MELLADRAFT_105987 [Melampsora larici-populina 98AG31]|uniref:Uncharacterized protein n=1 Tax=Melampsora larici-populina (strain 98AG31 / pathotype 3-4-7) TaxID=747676 RepID=F4RJZ9_MELLP|nr:uncharacterized protein MELLADRAFT_105987 [Melampsora larici-populina 98AG31]EGG07410.1 hypothetical protein MELLADRAFT_105987 [Melampsora larici-populina 98AG31]